MSMDRSAVIQAALCLIVLVIVPCASTLRVREVLNRTKQQDGCQGDEFRCTSGECIDTISMCDGTKKCADGSDETKTFCKQLDTTDLPSLPRRGGCLLPQPSEFGTYNAAECAFGNKTAFCRKFPGTLVPQNFALTFRCNKGFSIMETEDETLNTTCVNGTWLPQIPVCSKMCSPLVSLSAYVTCFNAEDEIDCNKPMRPGTRAKVECKPSYTQIRSPPYTEIICRANGQWSDELFHCRPVCGKRNRQGVNFPLIAHGSTTKYGEFPWHVGLYMMNGSNQWEQMCGGTLISPHVVMTAAHCVFSEVIKAKIPPEAIKVGLGKYYREWTRDEPYAVKANVREIVIPRRYFGHATSYTQDIALLDLTHSVQVHASIMPVCIDWKREFIITPGALGTLPGWGKTENATPSDVLLYADLPYIDFRQCIYEVPQKFQHYVTADKFCAGFNNGTGAAGGDAGGGLTFVQDDLYYVYGIASTKVQDVNSFITFTNISDEELFKWINYMKHEFDAAHAET